MKSRAEQSRADQISPDQSRAEDKVRARSVTSGQTARTNAEGEKLQWVQLRHAGPGPRGKGRISGDSRAKRSQGLSGESGNGRHWWRPAFVLPRGADAEQGGAGEGRVCTEWSLTMCQFALERMVAQAHNARRTHLQRGARAMGERVCLPERWLDVPNTVPGYCKAGAGGCWLAIYPLLCYRLTSSKIPRWYASQSVSQPIM